MKMFILALDGMDYDLAVKLNLENILQEQYGRLEVPINKEVGCPTSPEVWASFLCAEHVEKVFVGKNWIFKILIPLKKMFPFISLGLGKKVNGGLAGFPELGRKTWVDNFDVKEIGVPYYSYTDEAFGYTRDFSEDNNLELYRERLYNLFIKKSNEVLGEVENSKNFNIVFAYLHYPDLFNHAWFTKKDKLEGFYFEIDEYVGKLKNVLGETHLLIISDHGFDFIKNEHSQFGFVSSNIKMTLPKSIIGLGSHVKSLSEGK